METGDLYLGNVSKSTISISGRPTATGAGIAALTINGNIDDGVVINAPFGITTMTVGRQIAGALITTENPVTPSSGKLGTLTAGDILDATIAANTIGTLKTIGNLALFPIFGLQGNLANSNITAAATSGIGLGTLSVFGILSNTDINVPANATSITASQGINGGQIAVGFAATGFTTTASTFAPQFTDRRRYQSTHAARQQPDRPDRQRQHRARHRRSDHAVRNHGHRKYGAGKVGIGTMIVTGDMANTNINVFNGNVTSVALGAMDQRALLVGFDAIAANDIDTAVTSGTFSSGNFTLGTFKTSGAATTATGPAGTFADSLVVAAKLGTITLPSINTILDPTSPTVGFGIGFRIAAGSTAAGSVTIQGTEPASGFQLPGTNANFFYVGLAG